MVSPIQITPRSLKGKPVVVLALAAPLGGHPGIFSSEPGPACLTGEFWARKFAAVNAREIIQEIERLPRNEQVEVIRFVYRLDAERRLSGGELTSLAERLAGTADPADALILRDAIVRGFYDAKPNA